jgi:PAS domain S-box-containing protein
VSTSRTGYDKRKSGIPLIGDLFWGTHVCQFYDTQEDLLEILVPYFRAGLAANECCMWIASGLSDTAELTRALKNKLHRFEEYSAKGQLEVVPFRQWRAKGSRLADTIVSTLDKAVYSGFDGLRIGFHAKASQKKAEIFNSDGLDAIARYNVIGLVAYPRNQFDATRLMEVVSRHRYALVRNAARWEVIESSEARIVKDALNRSEQKLQSLFDNMSEGFAYHRIVLDSAGKPCDYVFLEANEAFQRLTGLKTKNIIGKRVTEVIPGISSDPTDWIGRCGEVALSGKPMQFESYLEQLQMWCSVSAFSPHRGFFAVTLSDITERKSAEEQLRKAHDLLEQKVRERTEELRRANSMLRMISECNEALVRATEEQQLMREICRIIVENGGYAMAWVGYAQDDHKKSVRPVASMGFENGYLKNAHISWDDNESGRGPTGTCIRTGKIRIGHDFLKDLELEPWRVEALKRGYRSSVALPLMFSGKAFGALMIYARTPNAFDEDQAGLLRELADDLAFGIMTLRARAERDQARWTAEKRAKQLQALAAELVEAEQKERRRLAQILHDHLQQLLV